MKLFAALLACVIVVAVHGQEFSPVPLKDPFESFKAAPVEEIQISGPAVATIKTGDFVHPTFSPDGKVLAYSKVIVRGDIENTEVLLYNLSSGRTSVLLNSRRAWKYATYKAFVSDMTWTSPRRLGVVIGDGDVDATRLTFDPVTRRLLRERPEPSGDIYPQPVSPQYKQPRAQALRLFPEIPADALDSALTNFPLVLPAGQGMVLQKSHAEHDHDVWFLDFQRKSAKRLTSLPDDARAMFNGGVSFGSSVIVALSDGSKTYLFLYRDEKIKPLTAINSPGHNWIEIKHRSSEGVVFLVRTHATSDKGDNPLFIFNGDRLLQVKEYPQLHDAAVDPTGQRIAFCYWEGERRHIAIKELN